MKFGKQFTQDLLFPINRHVSVGWRRAKGSEDLFALQPSPPQSKHTQFWKSGP